ncbi:MAG: carboxy-S-adenosyl-L-methionine synthase CmoA [Desulfobacteraceae bacterium]|jgi:tRNA (cmo5U34)-methyltransferase
MAKDNIYSEKYGSVPPFEFNSKVVDVFDDMINRSVPLYGESIRRMAQLAETFYVDHSLIYDLGCSNGNFGLTFLSTMGKKNFDMIGVDNSIPMLSMYKARLNERPNGENVHLVCGQMEDILLTNASVVVMNLSVQFLPVALRDDLIHSVYQSLLPSGILLVTEKTIQTHTGFTELFQDFYYRFKKENGYSNLEISQKRDALENVLIPETVETHVGRFRRAGFPHVDIWQKWFNFTSFICQK